MLGLLVPPSAHTFFHGCITLCIHTHVLVNKTKNYFSVFLRDKDKHFSDRAEKQTSQEMFEPQIFKTWVKFSCTLLRITWEVSAFSCFCDHQCKDVSSLIGHRGKSGKLGDLRVSLRLAALLLLYIFIIHCWYVLWLSFEYTY